MAKQAKKYSRPMLALDPQFYERCMAEAKQFSLKFNQWAQLCFKEHFGDIEFPARVKGKDSERVA